MHGNPLRPGRFVANSQDGGLPGIPGSGGSRDTGPSLPGIPGSGADIGGQSSSSAGGAGTPPRAPQAGVTFVNPSGPAGGGDPAPQSGPFELATWGQRFVAALLDGIIVAFILFAVAIPIIGLALTDTGDGGALVTAMVLGVFAYAVVVLLYAPVFMSMWRGATPGKRAVGIRVVRQDGRDVSFGDAALREVVFKSLLVGMIGQVTAGLGFLVNYLWPLWDDQNRAGHDFMAKTRVVRSR